MPVKSSYSHVGQTKSRVNQCKKEIAHLHAVATFRGNFRRPEGALPNAHAPVAATFYRKDCVPPSRMLSTALGFPTTHAKPMQQIGTHNEARAHHNISAAQSVPAPLKKLMQDRFRAL